MNAAEPGPAKTIAHLERLPEVLFQTLVAKLTERKIIVDVFGVVGGVLARRFDWLAVCQRSSESLARQAFTKRSRADGARGCRADKGGGWV